MRFLRCVLAILSVAVSELASAWELTFEGTPAYGYAYQGGVLEDIHGTPWFPTNWVVIHPNAVTNLNTPAGFAYSSNTLWLGLSVTSMVARHEFDLSSGGRGLEGRAGLRADRLRFSVVGASEQPLGTTIPLSLSAEILISSNRSGPFFHAYVMTKLSHWNEATGQWDPILAHAFTNEDSLAIHQFREPAMLRVGSRYDLSFLVACGAGKYGEPAHLTGRSLVSLTEGFSLDIALDMGSPQITLKGYAGRVYVVERSVNLMEWQPVATNCPPTGAFTFNDVTAPANGALFYRGVEKE